MMQFYEFIYSRYSRYYDDHHYKLFSSKSLEPTAVSQEVFYTIFVVVLPYPDIILVNTGMLSWGGESNPFSLYVIISHFDNLRYSNCHVAPSLLCVHIHLLSSDQERNL